MWKITFKPSEVTVFIERGSLLDAALKGGVAVESICGGRGVCGKCKVKIIVSDGGVPPPTPRERRILSNDEIERGYRLACMVKPRSDMEVYILPSSRRGRMRLQTEGVIVEAPLKPMVRKYYVHVPFACLEDQRSDEERLLETLRSEYGLSEVSIGLNALRKLPATLREGDWRLTAVVWGKEVVDIEAGDTSKEGFGVAVDVGTTKIALYLLSLIDGEELATASMENPQRAFGEDIMTRMTYANRAPENLQKLHEVVVEALNKLVHEACESVGIGEAKVYEAVVVGNTVMHHFLLNLETRYLSQSPYTQVLRRSFTVPSENVGLRINRSGYLHALPTVKSFVGADNVAVCLVTRIADAENPTLSLDIGTNTEIDCGQRELGLTVTSAPSGPAFEGWATKWGMTAAAGAIERISIDPETLEVMYRTIGDQPPVGICGSGYVDAIAEMMKAGILNHRSGFNALESNHVRKGDEGYELVVALAEKTGIGKDIVITQGDINEIVKAKAAIHAATTILLNHLKLREEDVDKIFLAGAFGSYIDPENARTIGMLPEVDLERIVPIGNAAGSGAKLALLNIDERLEAERISAKATFIELATHPMFLEEYVKSMYLPYKSLEKYPKTKELLSKLGFKTQ
ncbi:MAG: ASKHA domain-containing protein [Candidatus Bathyarchaeia archaeon]